MREPVSEGVRLLLIAEVEHVVERFNMMLLWLHALAYALRIAAFYRSRTGKL